MAAVVVLEDFRAIAHMLEVGPDQLVEAPKSLLDKVMSVVARLFSILSLRLESNI